MNGPSPRYPCGINALRCKEDCYWYAEEQDMGAHIPYCTAKNKFPIEPADCKNCEQFNSKYRVTNGNRLRAMSDVELAVWLAQHTTDTTEDWFEWLKQEGEK